MAKRTVLRAAVAVFLAALAAVIVFLTLLPLSPSNAWWVRMWEFPRLHLAVAAFVVLLLSIFAWRGARGWIAVAMLAVIAWQGSWAWPYAPWAAEQVEIDGAIDGGTAPLLLALNVLQSNDGKDEIRAYLDRVDADLVLLMETDRAWADALAPVLDRYETRIERVADDNYGMILATRLPVDRAELIELAYEHIPHPAPVAVVELRIDGAPMLFTGVHPPPPIPRFSRAERDRQTAIAARVARVDGVPAIAMGDFNDVAWSRSSQVFREQGDYLDPRAGRGIMASFKADSMIMRFPIDQGLVTDGVEVEGFEIGEDVGSDHFPILMRVRPTPNGEGGG